MRDYEVQALRCKYDGQTMHPIGRMTYVVQAECNDDAVAYVLDTYDTKVDDVHVVVTGVTKCPV